MKRTQVFEAADGTTFDTAADCRNYEESGALINSLQHLSVEAIENALNGIDVELAAAIERAGAIIAKKRRENGDLKRARKAPAAFEKVETAMRKTAK